MQQQNGRRGRISADVGAQFDSIASAIAAYFDFVVHALILAEIRAKFRLFTERRVNQPVSVISVIFVEIVLFFASVLFHEIANRATPSGARAVLCMHSTYFNETVKSAAAR